MSRFKKCSGGKDTAFIPFTQSLFLPREKKPGFPVPLK